MAARGLPGMNSPTTGYQFAITTRKEDGSFSSVGPHWTGKVELIESMLDIPLRRKKPTTYFVNSMSDLFHEALPDEAIDRVFAVMALCPQHTFQVLTKRAERMREYWKDPTALRDRWFAALLDQRVFPGDPRRAVIGNPSRAGVAEGILKGWRPLMLDNVRLGVSAEDQQRADERIPLLLQTPAAVRFISAEPLLGPVDLKRWAIPAFVPCICHPGLDWVIAGGESGPGARPCDLAWIRSIVTQCKAAGVPCFVKQLGSVYARYWNGDPNWKEKLNAKAGNPNEWPTDLRVREMPESQGVRGK
jgi:protein gp37